VSDIGRWVTECWNCGGDGWLGAQLDEDEGECPQCDGVGKIEVVRAIDYSGAVDALREAVKLARGFNRGAMTWQEYDRKLAALEVAHPGGQYDDSAARLDAAVAEARRGLREA
jgi:hypothetical protein